ncbi:hypothetical protein BpHYR1_030991 [Brachionus plicatilis]|uniref:Uncharacterized protein n=1 Tax=Brachionus plicatilis TaxID=10195 RepID=A0A3M7T6I4_BRAPC|nr:hypothetical protein BpHYR1_030991 [Brachionus plicatilis]
MTKRTRNQNNLYYAHLERFWEELKRRRSNGSIVNIGIESLTENFKNLFTTKNFRTYIRPNMYYGLEHCYINKSETKILQTLTGIIIKRMIGVKKRTHTANLLFALDIEPSSFVKRLLQNDYTTGLLQSIENKEFDENNFKNKFLNGIKGILKTQDKEIESEKKMFKNGISESIKTCFAMMNNNDQNGKTLLNLLIKFFKQIGKGEIEVNVQTIKNIIENLPYGKSCGFTERKFFHYKYLKFQII